MKILLLFTYNIGFLSQFFLDLGVLLNENEHKVFVMSLKDDEKRDFEINGVNVRFEKKGGYRNNYYKILRTITRVKPDIVISNFSYVNPALLFGRLLGVKKNVAWFHSLNEQMNPTQKNILIKTWFLKLADLVIANSSFTKNELISTYGVPEDIISTIPFWTTINSASDQSLLKNDNLGWPTIKIGCPGRLVHDKNQKLLIEAYSLLKSNDRQRVEIYFAGVGKDRLKLIELARNLGVEDRVHFLGQLSSIEVYEFYTSMNLIVLPSLHEAFGLVFIEAISLGIPVLVSENFGALTFIDKEKVDTSLFTFNPNSKTELKKKISIFINQRGMAGSDFKSMYKKTFGKDIVYNNLKDILDLK